MEGSALPAIRLVGTRRYANWIDAFVKSTENLSSPAIFRKWSAISILGSVLERRVWNRTEVGVLYPNLYVVLVSPPGAGKSNILSSSEILLRQVDGLHVCPSSVTTASIIDALNDATRHIHQPYPIQFNSLQVVASELQNFLPAYETSFLGVLTKLYDCEHYEERRRTAKLHIKIPKTQLSILAGTTPAYMGRLLPESSWDEGFTSRTIFIYSPTAEDSSVVFRDVDDLEVDDDAIVHDLRSMMKLFGQIIWDKTAQLAIQDWCEAGKPPVPEHSRLQHYKARRLGHTLKLSLIASVARSDSMHVTIEDFETAHEWLTEAEQLMPSIFQEMVITHDARIMDDARYHIMQLGKKLNGHVPEHYLIDFLRYRVSPQHIAKFIDVMVRAHMLQIHSIDGLSFYSAP